MAETGTASIEINAPADKIMRVITDIEEYPQWMDPFRKAEILERDEQGRPARAEFEMDAVIKRIHYVLQYSYPPDGIAWEKAEGDVKEIAGSYILEGRGGTTTVTYNYAIDPGIPVPGFMMRQGVKLMVSTALHDLKKRAESLPD